MNEFLQTRKNSPIQTNKRIHENMHNTNETLQLSVEEFHIPHALSLYNFYL
jgi:hypothetical protein